MTPRNIKTIAINRDDHVIYLKKASDFYEMAKRSNDSKIWTAVGLSSVHCAISCCDAILAYYLGIRSVSDDHMDAADLLNRIPKARDGAEVGAYKRIIAKKNLIAYECREFRQGEASEILKQVERFYRWTLSILSK